METQHVWAIAIYVALVALFMAGAVTMRNDIQASCDDTGHMTINGQAYTCAKAEKE